MDSVPFLLRRQRDNIRTSILPLRPAYVESKRIMYSQEPNPLDLRHVRLPPCGVPSLESAHLPTPALITEECLNRTERERFIAQRDKLSPDLRPFLTLFSIEEYDRDRVRLFLTADGNGGYGLKDGELISVFSLGGTRLGPALVHDAIIRGARKLECLDAHNHLSRFYARVGFIEIQRIPWDDQYAPADWNYARFGRPDLVFMELKS